MKLVNKIDREALEFILNVSRSSHPREFAGILRAKGDVIREILVLPGTLSSEESAVLRLHMMPIDPGACGTVHSHPSPSPVPSEDDLLLFAKFGRVHIVVAFPYNERSWRAYNHRGERVDLEVVG
ncbi:MAG: Mov34/MPN/PAD-1 family protein [Candidatus Hadarchaeum sp.]|uniref:Mov34/MPN/PAD-1 family protein n=1 Tax=Candidatus Hadarchaeum sp. TaxID=2883567 RepID=UPI003D140B9F